MPKISITSNTLVAGGAERQRVYLANWLAAQGHHVSLQLLQDRGPLESLIGEGVGVHDGITPPREKVDWLITGTTTTEVVFAVFCIVMRRARRWSVAVHNPVSDSAPSLAILPMLALVAAHDVIALTARHAHEIQRQWGIRPTHIIPNGISVPNLRPTPTDSQTIGYIGRISLLHKGLDRLVRAVARAPEISLSIAGDGPDKPDLERLVSDLELTDRVSFLGGVEPYEFYRNCRAIAVLSRWEAQPLVLLEARWMGVPAVVSAEIADIDDRFVVDGDDAEDALRGIRLAMDSGWQAPDERLASSVPDMGGKYEDIIKSKPLRRGRVSSTRKFFKRLIVGKRSPSTR